MDWKHFQIENRYGSCIQEFYDFWQCLKRKSSAILQFCYLQKLFHHFQRFAPLKLSFPKDKVSLFSRKFFYHWHLFHLNCYNNSDVYCFLLSSFLSFKNLFRSLFFLWFFFEGVLFINGSHILLPLMYLYPLAYFFFRGTCWSNVDRHILKNSSNCCYQILNMNWIFQTANYL